MTARIPFPPMTYPLVAILRGLKPEETAATIEALLEAGLRALGPALVPTCWGRNNRGQAGTGASTFVSQPPTPVVSILEGVRDIAAGADHACVVERARVVCWGANASGQLGNATTTDSPMPVEVNGIALR